jgi:hypothetical protein
LLIDQLDYAFIARLKPNRSEVFAADFHGLVTMIR